MEPSSEISHCCRVRFLLKCSWVKLTLWIFNQPRVFKIQIWHQSPSSYISMYLSVIYFTTRWGFPTENDRTSGLPGHQNIPTVQSWLPSFRGFPHFLLYETHVLAYFGRNVHVPLHSSCLCTTTLHSASLFCLISPAVTAAFHPTRGFSDTFDTLRTWKNVVELEVFSLYCAYSRSKGATIHKKIIILYVFVWLSEPKAGYWSHS